MSLAFILFLIINYFPFAIVGIVILGFLLLAGFVSLMNSFFYRG